MNKFEDIIEYIKSVVESPEQLKKLVKKGMINYEPTNDDKISDAMMRIDSDQILAFIEYRDTENSTDQKIAIQTRSTAKVIDTINNTKTKLDDGLGQVYLVATDDIFCLKHLANSTKNKFTKDTINSMANDIINKCKEARIKKPQSFFDRIRGLLNRNKKLTGETYNEIILKETLEETIEEIENYEKIEMGKATEQETPTEKVKSPLEMSRLPYESQLDRIREAQQKIAKNSMKSISPRVDIDHEAAKEEATKQGKLKGNRGKGIK